MQDNIFFKRKFLFNIALIIFSICIAFGSYIYIAILRLGKELSIIL